MKSFRSTWDRTLNWIGGLLDRDNNRHHRLVTSVSTDISFVDNEPINAYDDSMRNKCRTTRSTSQTERINNPENWEISSLLTHHVIKAYDDVIYGSDVPIELHESFSEHDRLSFYETRYERRHAVHVHNKTRFKEILKAYLAITRLKFI